MKLTSLFVKNFKALRSLSLAELGNAVVLAGPNGCGKSCVLDAIRLLKSAYGSYQQDEWQQWYAEFQIDLEKRTVPQLASLFHDKSRDVHIAAQFTLSEEEREFLRESSQDLLLELAWRGANANQGPMMGIRSGGFAQAANRRANREAVKHQVQKDLPQLLSALDQEEIRASVAITPQHDVETNTNILLELIFSIYEPQKLGVIDFHGPHRNYNREKIGNINLTIESSEQRSRQHALYNYNNKYSGLKTEMASAYVRHLLSKQAGTSLPLDDSLTGTLKELFTTFFPGKHFAGPRPTNDGRLLFPVLLEGGGEHDIDELSAGEKEVLYGYLRLQNSAPRHSIIMIDEPELHLNPRLISGLASFYYEHLGKSLDNQLVLVSHSDALIRDAVSHKEFSVFHIHPTSSSASNQAARVRADDEVEKLILELVGDLAAYRPGAKIVVFESTQDAAFDRRMTCSLFPDFEKRINPISVGNKKRVVDFYDLLESARKAGVIPAQVFSISDADDDGNDAVIAGPASKFCWDVYHIENYLLNPQIIHRVLRSLHASESRLPDANSVLQELRNCASATIPTLIQHRLRVHANNQLVPCINLNSDPQREDAAAAISEAIVRSGERIAGKVLAELTREKLENLTSEWNKGYLANLEDGTWLQRFRGRDVLKRFVADFGGGIGYEQFRELLLSRMHEDGCKPAGMANVVDAILNA